MKMSTAKKATVIELFNYFTGSREHSVFSYTKVVSAHDYAALGCVATYIYEDLLCNFSHSFANLHIPMQCMLVMFGRFLALVRKS